MTSDRATWGPQGCQKRYFGDNFVIGQGLQHDCFSQKWLRIPCIAIKDRSHCAGLEDEGKQLIVLNVSPCRPFAMSFSPMYLLEYIILCCKLAIDKILRS